MKILNKILILVSLCFNLFAQSAIVEPNSIKIDTDYEFKSSKVGYLFLNGFNSNFGPTIYFINNQTNTYRGAIGSFVTTGGASTFGMFSNSSINFATVQNNSFPSRLTITNSGVSTENPTTKLEVNGFTKLGSDAPAIKVKKIISTTRSTQGAQVIINHGLTDSKILSISVMVDTETNDFIHPSYRS